MDKIYLNELSLDGQFEDLDDFLDACIPFMKCLKFLKENGKTIYKHSTFFRQKITNEMMLNDLRGIRGDRVRRLKSLLLATTDNPPYWDDEGEFVQDLAAEYRLNGEDVTVTSIAEAAETDSNLLSFQHSKYSDCLLDIWKNEKPLRMLRSAVSLGYLSEALWEKSQIDVYTYLNARYFGTRLDFSQLEEQYGFGDFEKEEFRDCLQAFDKFVERESWEDIVSDRGLYYKKYSPSSSDQNWFKHERYQNKEIYKFRCGNPKRCFGYRENDVFYVLRMERDHKISDYG